MMAVGSSRTALAFLLIVLALTILDTAGAECLGAVRKVGTTTRYEGRDVGSRAYIVCGPGLGYTGDPFVCTASGSWSGEWGSCAASITTITTTTTSATPATTESQSTRTSCPTTAIPGGHIVANNVSEANIGVVYCRTGYRFTSFLRYTLCTAGKWRTPFGICAPEATTQPPTVNPGATIRLYPTEINYEGYQGRLHIRRAGEWGTVCNNNFDIDDAAVACRQLGLGAPVRYPVTDYVNLNPSALLRRLHHIWLDQVGCTGTESSLRECPSSPLGQNNCTHSQDVVVHCGKRVSTPSTGIRLNNNLEITDHGHRGSIRMFLSEHSRVWVSVQKDSFNSKAAVVACRQLGLGRPVKHPVTDYEDPLVPPRIRATVIVLPQCNGNEESLQRCPYLIARDDRTRDTYVYCAHPEVAREEDRHSPLLPRPRKFSIRQQHSGRLEVFYNGEWGTVCQDNFSWPDAEVACRQLGYRFVTQFFNDPGSGPIWVDELDCVGNESSLFDCPQRMPFGGHDCQHVEDVGVLCSDTEPTTSPPPPVCTGSVPSGGLGVQYKGRQIGSLAHIICPTGFRYHGEPFVCTSNGWKDSLGFCALIPT